MTSKQRYVLPFSKYELLGKFSNPFPSYREISISYLSPTWRSGLEKWRKLQIHQFLQKLQNCIYFTEITIKTSYAAKYRGSTVLLFTVRTLKPSCYEKLNAYDMNSISHVRRTRLIWCILSVYSLIFTRLYV